MRPEWFRLEAGEAAEVWRDQRAGFLGRVAGPHFETICRDFALRSGLFGGPAAEVGSGVVKNPAAKTQIEIDVAVLGPAVPGERRRILSLGEVKWGDAMDQRHVQRLAAARDLLAADYDVSGCVLACYSAAGFDEDLRAAAARDSRLVLVGLADIYP
jgi:hypothetical protein